MTVINPGDAAPARMPSPSPTADVGHEDSSAVLVQASKESAMDGNSSHNAEADPPLPDDEAPPLPDEPPPSEEDDGWEPKWDYNAGAYYFFNNKTGVSQWENPRIPTASTFHGAYDRFANDHRLRISSPPNV